MKIFIGTDHNGFHLKEKLIEYLAKSGHEIIDDGNTELNPDDDFPAFAAKVTHSMLSSDEKDPRGILICGSGQGICMAANRFKGIRAALLYDQESARTSRNDDDSNIACLPARTLDENQAFKIIDAWLSTPFADAPRFRRRLRELDELG